MILKTNMKTSDNLTNDLYRKAKKALAMGFCAVRLSDCQRFVRLSDVSDDLSDGFSV